MADLAAQIDALSELIDRYEQLEIHALGEPGRTPERRDLMRAISSRHPGALRELDCIGLDGVRTRGAAARAVRDQLRDGDRRGLDAPAHAWMRYAIELVPRLRAVLAVKFWLADNGVDPAAPGALARIRACYPDVDGDLLERIAAPPGGQVQQLAYRDAARALGVDVETLKRTLYPPTDTADDQ